MSSLAAAVRLVHALYVASVALAPFALLALSWVPAPAKVVRALRVAHLATVAWAAWQLALGWPCPLSTLEHALAGTPEVAFLPSAGAHVAALVGVAVHLGVGIAAQWRLASPPRRSLA